MADNTITKAQAKDLVEEGVKLDREARREKEEKAKIKEQEAAIGEQNKKIGVLERSLAKAQEAPNHEQALIEGTVAIGTGLLSFKGSMYLLDKTATGDTWVKNGESTFLRKFIVHGTFPLIGIMLIGGGYMLAKKNGAAAAGLYGAGFGLVLGSLIRSVFGAAL